MLQYVAGLYLLIYICVKKGFGYENFKVRYFVGSGVCPAVLRQTRYGVW
jgi:hypothetical protein